jgi:HAD superfamily hydrolase (TIGR01509 family)
MGRVLAAVLFDMDGTLVDSEKVWSIALDELAAEYGGVLSPRARLAMVGSCEMDTMAILHADLDQPWRDPVAGAKWLTGRVKQLFAAGLEWQPGARELLAAVRDAGLPTALVTNTGRSLTQIALGTLGAENFDFVVCGDEVERPKPHPMPYVTAAAALGVAPCECVAIEDSQSGITSARAAGCRVLAVPSEFATDEGAELVVSLAEVDVSHLQDLLNR